jgi:hypothetical protein
MAREFINPRDINPYALGEVGQAMRQRSESKEVIRQARIKAMWKRLGETESVGDGVNIYDAGLMGS